MSAPGGAQGAGGSGSSTLIMIALMGVVFYFFMIRPQMKKSKEQRKFKDNIGEGDKVVTIGGVHGKIVKVEDTTFILELYDKQRIKVEKAAISMDSTMAIADANKSETGKATQKEKPTSDKKRNTEIDEISKS